MWCSTQGEKPRAWVPGGRAGAVLEVDEGGWGGGRGCRGGCGMKLVQRGCGVHCVREHVEEKPWA